MSKRRHFRIRRILKWVSLFAFAGSLILWCASLRWFIQYNAPRFSCTLDPGRFIFVYLAEKRKRKDLDWPGWTTKTQEPIVNVFRLSMGLPQYRVHKNKSSGRTVIVPFWAAVALFAIPTAFLWHLDRPRLRPGRCRACGHELTGNVSGVCPECGHRIRALQERAGSGAHRSQHLYNIPRYSRLLSLAVAVPAFCLFFFVLLVALENAPDIESGSWESIRRVVLLFLWLFIPYLGARFVFSKMRWRTVMSDAPLCPNCLYDLTGNTSGICPECGLRTP